MAKESVTNSEIRYFLNKQLDLLVNENEKVLLAKTENLDEERLKKKTVERIEREIEIIGVLSSLIK